MRDLGREELLATLLADARGDVLKDIELSVDAVVHSIRALNNLPSAVYAVAVGFECCVRILSKVGCHDAQAQGPDSSHKRVPPRLPSAQ